MGLGLNGSYWLVVHLNGLRLSHGGDRVTSGALLVSQLGNHVYLMLHIEG